ncbi:MAG: hypothetical protein JWN08_3616 [Frankiales bacterium]|nr:hypothetical protein [Frankiales bacterium]
MHGLTIRWSLMNTPTGTEQALRDYVRDTSAPRFTGMPGLVQKTWQLADRGFFSGIYVFATKDARAEFLATFRANPSPVSQLLGNDPDIVQEWELIGVAVGAEGPLTP